jgi:hypothetical protein
MRLSYLSEESHRTLKGRCDETSRMLHVLMQRVRS